MTSLDSSRIAVQSLGRVWGPAGFALNLLEESVDQQDGCEISRKSLDNIRITVKSLGRVWIPAD